VRSQDAKLGILGRLILLSCLRDSDGYVVNTVGCKKSSPKKGSVSLKGSINKPKQPKQPFRGMTCFGALDSIALSLQKNKTISSSQPLWRLRTVKTKKGTFLNTNPYERTVLFCTYYCHSNVGTLQRSSVEANERLTTQNKTHLDMRWNECSWEELYIPQPRIPTWFSPGSKISNTAPDFKTQNRTIFSKRSNLWNL